MTWLKPLTLRGTHAILEPLSQSHHDDLVEAVKDGELWNLWYTHVPTPEGMGAEIERRLELQSRGMMLPFTVIAKASGTPVGMTTYTHIDAVNRRLGIGYTWYRRSLQRTLVNTECKFMLLRQAFESLDCIAVEFQTHFFNRPSRRAIERLGAKLDGVLRSHQMAPNGTLRDTCVYSIIAGEWPAVKANLEYLLRGDEFEA